MGHVVVKNNWFLGLGSNLFAKSESICIVYNDDNDNDKLD